MSKAVLEDRYAKLLGELKVIETQAENANGLKEIVEAEERIDREKTELRRRMDQVRDNIRLLYDADWEPFLLTPKLPKPKEKYPLVGRQASAILRKRGGWMKPQELAHLVMAEMGVEPDYRLANKFALTIRGGLMQRVKEGWAEKRGAPAEFRITPRPPLKPPGVSANSLPTPWRPASSPPAARAKASADHCPSDGDRPAKTVRPRSSVRSPSKS